MRDNLQVKEVNIGSADRFVLCYNPEQAEHDAVVRATMVAQLEEVIADTDKLTKTERARLEGVISTKPGLKRFLRVTPGGLLRVDKKKIAAETNLDGKYLLRSSDPKLSPEDIALGYKQLLEVEGVWSALKRSLANLAPHSTDALAALVKTRLRVIQYRRDGLLDGFIAETGLGLGLGLEPP